MRHAVTYRIFNRHGAVLKQESNQRQAGVNYWYQLPVVYFPVTVCSDMVDIIQLSNDTCDFLPSSCKQLFLNQVFFSLF